MYIEKYNILFIHIVKNGGTSIEKYFLNDLDKNTKKNILFYDFIKKSNNMNIIFKFITLFYSILPIIYKIVNLFNSILPTHYILLGRDYHYTVKTYNNYVKTKLIPKIFTVVRHPRSRAISLYKFSQAYKYITFEEFITTYILSKNIKYTFWGNTQYSCLLNNKNIIDKNITILHLENIDYEFKFFCEKNNITYNGPLRKENISDIISEDTVDFKKLPEKLVNEFDEYFKLDYITFGYYNLPS
jgi:hypothetical protein